jgi:2-polyprenyl-3-methyl-5-hydroxy-6-metoxy-1,4-benzoquinol methylase
VPEVPAKTKAARGRRFDFGGNWKKFAASVGEDQIASAEASLSAMLGTDSLRGQSFLDVGCGSGLFSLAAARLGASRIHSFDFDPGSVESAESLKRRFMPAAGHWTIGQGSVLDTGYLAGLGLWDVVYAWGVLHHTGHMWRAIRNVQELMPLGGRLFIAIYNDQGLRSRAWRQVKRFYNRSPAARRVVLAFAVPLLAVGAATRDVLHGRNPLHRYARQDRGMSLARDWRDWLGGYPFECARPEELIEHFQGGGFVLERQRTVGRRLGCNEFVFRR